MTDTGRAEAALAEMQEEFIQLHNSCKGVMSDNEVSDMLTGVAQNYGAGFDGDVTSADDDGIFAFLIKTQDVRLKRVNNTMMVISDSLNRAIPFTPGETLSAIEARAVASSNERGARIAKLIAEQITVAFENGLNYNTDYPTTNIKYKVPALNASSNESVFDGVVASYKVPSKNPGKFFGRVALIGAKNSHESESNKRFSTVEDKVMNMEAVLSLGIANADKIEKRFQNIESQLADTENRLKNTENLIQSILAKLTLVDDGEGDGEGDPDDPNDPNDPDDPNDPVFG